MLAVRPVDVACMTVVVSVGMLVPMIVRGVVMPAMRFVTTGMLWLWQASQGHVECALAVIDFKTCVVQILR